jgi:hypothetical protein
VIPFGFTPVAATSRRVTVILSPAHATGRLGGGRKLAEDHNRRRCCASREQAMGHRIRITATPELPRVLVRIGASNERPRCLREAVSVSRARQHVRDGMRRLEAWRRHNPCSVRCDGSVDEPRVPREDDSVIRRLASGSYRLYSQKRDPRTGKRRNLGTFPSRAAALRRERQIQFFKRAH